MGSQVERTRGKALEDEGGQGGSWQTRKGGGWWGGWSHTCEWINQEEQLWSETDCTTQGSSTGKESLKTSD